MRSPLQTARFRCNYPRVCFVGYTLWGYPGTYPRLPGHIYPRSTRVHTQGYPGIYLRGSLVHSRGSNYQRVFYRVYLVYSGATRACTYGYSGTSRRSTRVLTRVWPNRQGLISGYAPQRIHRVYPTEDEFAAMGLVFMLMFSIGRRNGFVWKKYAHMHTAVEASSVADGST